MPSHSEIAGVSGTVGAVVSHGHAEILSVTGGVGSISGVDGHAEFTQVTGFAGVATSGSHAEFAGISGGAAIPTTLQARGGPDLQVPAFLPTTLDGSGSTGAWTDTTWTLVSDTRTPRVAPLPTVLEPIDLSSQTDPLVTITFPAYHQNYTVVLQFTISDGVSISTDTVTVQVWAWLDWRVKGTGWVGRPRYRVRPDPPTTVPTALLPDSGVFPDTGRLLRI